MALASGIGIAAACGLRAFLPLLLLGLASRVGLLHLRGGAEWIASDLALVALGVATVVEVIGDKVPVVDHVLDVIGTGLRPAAAWLGAYAVLQAWPTPWAQIAAFVLGSLALGVHALKAKLRLGSSAATLGHANPLLSVAEDGVSLVIVAAALLIPIVLLVALAALAISVLLGRRRRAAV